MIEENGSEESLNKLIRKKDQENDWEDCSGRIIGKIIGKNVREDRFGRLTGMNYCDTGKIGKRLERKSRKQYQKQRMTGKI